LNSFFVSQSAQHEILQSFGKSAGYFSDKLAHYNNNWFHDNDTIVAGFAGVDSQRRGHDNTANFNQAYEVAKNSKGRV
jgi:hypothetical protein